MWFTIHLSVLEAVLHLSYRVTTQEYKTRYTAGISRAVAEEIRFKPLQAIAKTALINNKEYTADPGLFFKWRNRITKERWPDTPLARERKKGMRTPPL